MRWPLYLVVVIALSSCSPSDIASAALGAATGGGPKVNANAQVGAENNQAITVGIADRVTGDKTTNNETVKADSVETVVVNEIGFQYLLLLLLGWILPTPSQMADNIRKLLSGLWRKKNDR